MPLKLHYNLLQHIKDTQNYQSKKCSKDQPVRTEPTTLVA